MQLQPSVSEKRSPDDVFVLRPNLPVVNLRRLTYQGAANALFFDKVVTLKFKDLLFRPILCL